MSAILFLYKEVLGRELDWLVSNKPRGRPVKYNEADRRRIVQAVDTVKAEMPGPRTDTAAIKELFKRHGRRRSTADAANLGRRLPEWRRLPRK